MYKVKGFAKTSLLISLALLVFGSGSAAVLAGPRVGGDRKPPQIAPVVEEGTSEPEQDVTLMAPADVKGLELAPPEQGVDLGLQTPDGIPMFPCTVWGRVHLMGVAPEAGKAISVYSVGTLVAQGATELYEGRMVYAINVNEGQTGAVPQDGDPLTVVVDGTEAQAEATFLSGGEVSLNLTDSEGVSSDVDGDGRSDVVGFGNNGVLVSLSSGRAFDAADLWIGNFGPQAGGWMSFDLHPRILGDVNGDGLDDVVGFGTHGVLVSPSNGNGFDTEQIWLGDFGVVAGGWVSYDRHPRMVGDVNGDGLDDVIGFGNHGVLVALSSGSGFDAAQVWLGDFGVVAGGWVSYDRHPRMIGDVNGDGLDDVIGFGNHGVLVALSNGSGFDAVELWLGDFGVKAGGWTSFDRHPRTVADVNGDGLDDVVGFGNHGVLVSLSNGSGFDAAQVWLDDFGVVAGGWTSFDRHPRTVADVNGDGLRDVVGFGNNGVLVALSNGSGFETVELWLGDFGVKAGSWTSFDRNPRSPGIR